MNEILSTAFVEMPYAYVAAALTDDSTFRTTLFTTTVGAFPRSSAENSGTENQSRGLC